MLDPNHPISQIAREDGRYGVDAYTFVFEALNHAHTAMESEKKDTSDETEAAEIEQLLLSEELEIADADVYEEIECLEQMAEKSQSSSDEAERHVTGQELCRAIRSLALEQYGYMAKCVLNS